MKILYVYAHPHDKSFNTALKDVAVHTLTKNHEIKISDLYHLNFDAVLNWQELSGQKPLPNIILEEQEKLAWCELVIFQFPLWWFSTPAVLKGWFDRVFTKGFAYDTGKILENGLLKGRKAMLVLTTQSPNGMEPFLNHIHHTLNFVGIKTLEPFIAYGVMDEDNEKREGYIEQYAKKLQVL